MAELLAPAGSKEALVAAVEAGADAVYLAGKMFGARAYASNFDEATLRWAIRFAHLYGVSIHVTVNTIVRDEEFPALAPYLRFLYEAGVDAILVQDFGVARLAREIVPDLPLHASTQMTIYNVAGAQAMEKLGFTRVVLARELSLAEIRQICERTDLEVEVFMHGALCVCYSGQCLMSSMIGGRSGNRGRCAQPCRLPYALVDERGQEVLRGEAGEYLLSPRDLNTLPILPELLATGVTSLKIEGRMKRPEYVATVVRTYRAALDRIAAQGGEAFAATAEEEAQLAQIFNRDFTTAYLLGRPGRELMSDRRPNNRGLFVGRVLRYDKKKRRVALRLTGRLAVGDQVDFWVKVGGRVAVTVTELTDERGQAIAAGGKGETVMFPVPTALHEHDRAFKVYDAQLMAEAKSYYTGPAVRRVPVGARVTAAVGAPLKITLTDAAGHTATAETAFLGEPAQKRPLTEEAVRKQVDRLGSSVFGLRSFYAELTGAVMVPVSEINEARRQAVEKLEELRLAEFARPPLPATRSFSPPATATSPAPRQAKPSALIVSVDTLAKAQAAYEAGAEGVLFGGDSYQHRELTASLYQKVWELAKERGRLIYFQTPRIVREEHWPRLAKLLASLADTPPDALYVPNIGTLHWAQEQTTWPIHTDSSFIAYNSGTLKFLQEQGVRGVTLSPELTWEQAKALARQATVSLECLVHGPLELMVSEYCPLGTFLGGAGGKSPCAQPCRQGHYALQDRKGILFPVVTDQFCHLHILNSRPLSMLPYAADFAPAGIARLRIEGKALAPREIAKLVRAYQKIRHMTPEERQEASEYIASIEGKEHTRGHYFRGVE